MKFTMYPAPWDNVVDEVAAAGHEFVDRIEDADFLIFNGGPRHFPDPLPENIGFVQHVFTGVEHLIGSGTIKPGVRWANSAGVYGTPVAEIAMTLLLSQLHQVKAVTQAGSFDVRWEADAKQGWLFSGRTVALIGAGGIARAMIPMLRPFGVKIIAVNRSGTDVDGADETFAVDQAEHVWGEADAFILTMPLTDETRGMIDAEVLGKMKSNAVVVNVGRGQLVVTDDLVDALRDGVIAGAAMDVTEPEPLPENHPLWRMPNATITPHIAATARIARKMIAPQIVDNAAAFGAGERMPTEVDVEAGY